MKHFSTHASPVVVTIPVESIMEPCVLLWNASMFQRCRILENVEINRERVPGIQNREKSASTLSPLKQIKHGSLKDA